MTNKVTESTEIADYIMCNVFYSLTSLVVVVVGYPPTV